MSLLNPESLLVRTTVPKNLALARPRCHRRRGTRRRCCQRTAVCRRRHRSPLEPPHSVMERWSTFRVNPRNGSKTTARFRHSRTEAVNKWDWLYGALALARQVASSVVPVPFIHFALADHVVKKWDRHRTLNRCVARTQVRCGASPIFSQPRRRESRRDTFHLDSRLRGNDVR